MGKGVRKSFGQLVLTVLVRVAKKLVCVGGGGRVVGVIPLRESATCFYLS